MVDWMILGLLVILVLSVWSVASRLGELVAVANAIRQDQSATLGKLGMTLGAVRDEIKDAAEHAKKLEEVGMWLYNIEMQVSGIGAGVDRIEEHTRPPDDY